MLRGDIMSDNMNDLFASVKKMVDSGNIPDDLKNMMNNFNSSGSSNNNSNNNLNDVLSQISPEMINNMSSMLNNGNSNNNNSNNSSAPNIDMGTIMKMKSIMDNMNNKNDPRANLLYSLKPYLRDSKKSKLDQYVNLLNISKIADIMNSKEDKKNE